MSKTTTRTKRADPYLLDGLFVSFHRSAAGVAWRWRTELAVLTATIAALWRLALLITLPWAAGTLLALVTLLLGLPVTRRFTVRRFWCVLIRHRLQRVCYETRMHTRSGRLPLILWIRPTRAGVRAHVLCRAGTCAEDFTDNAAEISAACFSRAVQVTHNPNWSHLVTIDIMRGDLLNPRRIIPAVIATDDDDIRPAISA